MANFKKKHHGYRGCKLCKPHKSWGNSAEAIQAKYRSIRKTKIIFDCE